MGLQGASRRNDERCVPHPIDENGLEFLGREAFAGHGLVVDCERRRCAMERAK